MLHRQPPITLEIKRWDFKPIRTYFFFIFSLKPERLEEERMSSSREFHKETEDEIQDFLQISVRVKGIVIFLLFLSVYCEVSLTRGGINSYVYIIWSKTIYRFEHK